MVFEIEMKYKIMLGLNYFIYWSAQILICLAMTSERVALTFFILQDPGRSNIPRRPIVSESSAVR